MSELALGITTLAAAVIVCAALTQTRNVRRDFRFLPGFAGGVGITAFLLAVALLLYRVWLGIPR